MYTTYIIESITSGRWYIGNSYNVCRRIQEHNSRLTVSTRNKGPWKMIFSRSFDSRREAIEFEYKLKKHKNKHYIREEYPQYFLGM